MFKLLCIFFLVGTATSIDIVDLGVDLLQSILLILTGVEIDYTGDCPLFNSSHVKFYLYNAKQPNTSIDLTNGNRNQVNPALETKVLIHGWISTYKSWGPKMKDAYFKIGSYNIILVDWSAYSFYNYAESFCEVPRVGTLVGNLILDLQEKVGLNLNKTHIIGHSLGAQIAGYAGQGILNLNSGKKLGRITGLDAAGPGYYYAIARPKDERLTPDDAYFVDGIHTSHKTFGYLGDYGTVDFFPNCGAYQTGCLNFTIPDKVDEIQDLLPNVGCSHERAVDYYIESITTDGFVATFCSECIPFGLGACKENEKLIMGEHCKPPKSEADTFYLSTNPNEPYAIGKP